jgi:hypothetical protein
MKPKSKVKKAKQSAPKSKVKRKSRGDSDDFDYGDQFSASVRPPKKSLTKINLGNAKTGNNSAVVGEMPKNQNRKNPKQKLLTISFTDHQIEESQVAIEKQIRADEQNDDEQNERIQNHFAEQDDLDYNTLTNANSWVSHAVVDTFVDLLRQMARPDVQIEKCETWMKINGMKKIRDKLVKRWEIAKRFQNTKTILWTMIARNHFALCKVDVTKCEIRIYDSIETTKWSTVELKVFLKSIFGDTVTDYTGQQYSRQQENSNDCGVYTMANLRSIVEGKDVRLKRMFGNHQTDTIREKKVAEMREQMTRELQNQKLEAWK